MLALCYRLTHGFRMNDELYLVDERCNLNLFPQGTLEVDAAERKVTVGRNLRMLGKEDCMVYLRRKEATRHEECFGTCRLTQHGEVIKSQTQQIIIMRVHSGITLSF